MPSGEFTFAEQIGQSGFYARICVEVFPEPDGGLVIHFEPDVPQRWRAAVEFGIVYAWEQLTRTDRRHRGAAVRVREVDWQISDTTHAGIAFATVRACWQAVGFTPTRVPSFDRPSEQFCLPN